MDSDGPEGFYSEPKVLTAAQRKKLKKKQQALEQENQREATIANSIDLRLLEEEDISNQLAKEGKRIFKILGDGNCLFRAIEHQLAHVNKGNISQCSHDKLRQLAVDHLVKNKTEYEAFVTSLCIDTGCESYEAYCNKMAQDGEWGGEVEILALSRVLGHNIVIYQHDAKPKVYGENNGNTLYVTFHKYAYALGGHYNSTTLT